MFSVAQYHWFNRPTQNPQKSKDVNFSLECIPCLVSAPLWRSDLKHKQSGHISTLSETALQHKTSAELIKARGQDLSSELRNYFSMKRNLRLADLRN